MRKIKVRALSRQRMARAGLGAEDLRTLPSAGFLLALEIR